MFNGRIADATAVTRQHLSLNPNDARARKTWPRSTTLRALEDTLRQTDLAIRLSPLDRRMCPEASPGGTALIPLQPL